MMTLEERAIKAVKSVDGWACCAGGPTNPGSKFGECEQGYCQCDLYNLFVSGAREQAPISFADGRAVGYEEGVRACVAILKSDDIPGAYSYSYGHTDPHEYAELIESRLLNRDNEKREDV